MQKRRLETEGTLTLCCNSDTSIEWLIRTGREEEWNRPIMQEGDLEQVRRMIAAEAEEDNVVIRTVTVMFHGTINSDIPVPKSAHRVTMWCIGHELEEFVKLYPSLADACELRELECNFVRLDRLSPKWTQLQKYNGIPPIQLPYWWVDWEKPPEAEYINLEPFKNLRKIILQGLGSPCRTEWSRFLTQGMYDPRLFLYVKTWL